MLPQGWFVPVSPGTRHVTIGGAIAADIHGKNHHRDGAFCQHVVELTIDTPAEGRLRLTADGDLSEAFWATAGGMGLTGVVLDATIRLLPVETSLMTVDTDRAADLDEAMTLLAASDERYRYSVAWIDLMATGRSTGRSVLTQADHARLDELPARRRAGALDFDPSTRLPAPPAPSGLLNRLSVRAFNEFWFRKAPKRRRDELQSITRYFHPLDMVEGWNRLYGPRGFLQHQFVVPFGAEATLADVVSRLSRAGLPSFLAVLKRFGAADPGPLSFPMPGWTLALDIPAGPAGLAELLDDLDRLVVDCGGRVYLAKDSRLSPTLLPAMYPRLDEWRQVRAKLDPDRRLMSDLARRLEL